ncbi:MAG: hypothetical protein ACQEWV_25520 [Bacillota bacterium]
MNTKIMSRLFLIISIVLTFNILYLIPVTIIKTNTDYVVSAFPFNNNVSLHDLNTLLVTLSAIGTITWLVWGVISMLDLKR